jgi:hypothetical protein
MDADSSTITTLVLCLLAEVTCLGCCPPYGYLAALGRVLERVGVALATKSEVGHFAAQIAVDEYVARCQVTVDVVHVGQVAHAARHVAQHVHELGEREASVLLLHECVE